MKKVIFLALIGLALSGCSNLVMLNGHEKVKAKIQKCDVKVWATKESAEKNGSIKEICLISGTSARSFSHTVATAIAKHKNRACECGATNVYVTNEDHGTLGTASVTLVAFEYE